METTCSLETTRGHRWAVQGMSGALVWLWLVLLPPVNTAELTRYADQTGTISALNAPDERMTTEVSPFRRRAQPVWLSQHELRHTIRSAARQHRLSPALLWAVIKAESNFNAVAVSAKGALGLMQLMPATAAFVKIEDPLNPIENIRGGARYLRYLLNQFNEDLPLALAAYNAGPGHVRRNQGQVPAIPQTQDYVEKVLAFYDEFQSAPHQRSI